MMFFDTKAALAKIQNLASNPAAFATSATQTTKTAPHAADAADVATSKGRVSETADEIADALDAFEERAAICEYDGGLSRADAEDMAAQCQGYENVVAFRAAQMKASE